MLPPQARVMEEPAGAISMKPLILHRYLSYQLSSYATIINMRGLKSLTKKEAQKIISNIVATNKTRPLGAVMGIVMKELKGKVEGSLIAELVKNCYDA